MCHWASEQQNWRKNRWDNWSRRQSFSSYRHRSSTDLKHSSRFCGVYLYGKHVLHMYCVPGTVVALRIHGYINFCPKQPILKGSCTVTKYQAGGQGGEGGCRCSTNAEGADVGSLRRGCQKEVFLEEIPEWVLKFRNSRLKQSSSWNRSFICKANTV